MRARGGAQLVEQAFDVGFDGAHADAQFARDRLVALALGQQLQHVGLAAGETNAGEAVGHAAAQICAQVAHAASEGAHGGEQLVGRAVLQQVAVHAGHHRRAHFPFAIELGNDQYPWLGVAVVAAAGVAHMLHAGLVVEDDDVGAMQVGAVLRHAHFHIDVGAQQRGQAGADDCVRMGHQYRDFFSLLRGAVVSVLARATCHGRLGPAFAIESHVVSPGCRASDGSPA